MRKVRIFLAVLVTGLFLVGIKFGIILGIFAGIISFVPFIGAFLGGGITLILGFFSMVCLLNCYLYHLQPQLLNHQLLHYILQTERLDQSLGSNPIV